MEGNRDTKCILQLSATPNCRTKCIFDRATNLFLQCLYLYLSSYGRNRILPFLTTHDTVMVKTDTDSIITNCCTPLICLLPPFPDSQCIVLNIIKLTSFQVPLRYRSGSGKLKCYSTSHNGPCIYYY